MTGWRERHAFGAANAAPATDPLFDGPGEMRALCRARDWTATSLGPVDRWPLSLRTTVANMLASRHPMFLWWGTDLVQFYNDAYRPSFAEGGRHLRALGARGAEFWLEIWHIIGPQIVQVMNGGESTWHENQLVPIERNGRLEDVWWTYSYSPAFDDDGRIGGVLVVCQETTEHVLADRDRDRLLEATALAEAAAREREARLGAIYDGTYEYIGLLAPDGTLLEANRASLEFAGNKREDVVGRPFWDTPWFTFTPGAPEFIRDAVARAADGEFVRAEADLRRPSGEMTTFDLSLHPIRDADDNVVLIVPEGRDVTEQRRAERTLHEAETRYRTLFNSLDDGFCVIEMIFDERDDPVDYRVIEVNTAFVDQTGRSDSGGKRIGDLVPAHVALGIPTYGRVAKTGEPMRFQQRSDALNRWYDVYAFPLGPAKERRVAVMFRDVSISRLAADERERLVQALEVERERLEYVFQRAPSFLAVMRGSDHTIDLVNDAYLKLVGYRALVGQPVRDAIPEAVEQGFVTLLDEVLATGEPFVGKEVRASLVREASAPPEDRFVDVVYLPIIEADGTRSGVIVHGTDVTEQVRSRHEIERLYAVEQHARTALQDALAVAEGANRAKSDFLAVMSHELRTPLNAIGGYTTLLELGIRGPVTPEQHADLNRIQGCQRHLLGLINEVLNYAKLETGTVQYDIVDVPLHEVVSDAESLVSPQAVAKRLTLGVAETPRNVHARADGEKLRQILVNLLSNAVKFTHPGGRIDMWCDVEDTRVLVNVRDSGIGIPREKLDAIFDPFVQVRSDLTRPNEGTGLGLAISRDLARGMEGDLTVRSAMGAGSTFTLTLPGRTGTD